MKNFAPFDAPLDPKVARLVDIYQVLHFVLKFDISGALYIFLTIFKVIPEVSLLQLMTIFQVLLLIIRLNNTNSKLPQTFIS